MVGKRIRELRKQRKMSLQALADSIPLSVSFLSDIENGRSNPSIKRLEEIALALDTTVAYIIEGNAASLDDYPESFQADPVFTEVVDRLNNFDAWNPADKEELLIYLRAKEVIRRENEKHKNQKNKKS